MELHVDNDAVQREVLSVAPSASLLDNRMLAFFAGLSIEDRQYIKNSLRWAEYQANLRFDRKLEPADWFEHVSGRLWSVGWSLEHAPVEVIDHRYKGSLLDSWSKALSTQVSRARLKLIKDSFGFLEHDRSALAFFTERAQQSGDFRFMPAEYNRAGELEIVLTNVRLLSTNWSSTVLFWDVEHPQSQLDIRARRFSARPREMDKYRVMLADAVRNMRFSEITLTMTQ